MYLTHITSDHINLLPVCVICHVPPIPTRFLILYYITSVLYSGVCLVSWCMLFISITALNKTFRALCLSSFDIVSYCVPEIFLNEGVGLMIKPK